MQKENSDGQEAEQKDMSRDMEMKGERGMDQEQNE